MRVRRVRKTRNITFAPYGSIPIYDAKSNVTLTLSASNVKNGRKNDPLSCAINLAIRDIALSGPQTIIADAAMKSDEFPKSEGSILAAKVSKTFTLTVASNGRRVAAFRRVHKDPTRRGILKWDRSEGGLKAGQQVTLYAPRGARKLGVSNGRSGSGTGYPKKPGTARRRGMFINPLEGMAAKRDDSTLTLV